MIPINIPQLQDRELYELLRKLALLAVAYNEIIKSGLGANRPTTGRRVFYYATDEKQWYAYTGDGTVGNAGWVMFG
jgi:hypothetical protein